MICKNCNSTIDDDSFFCKYCGRRVNYKCPACNMLISIDNKFCPFCGDKNEDKKNIYPLKVKEKKTFEFKLNIIYIIFMSIFLILMTISLFLPVFKIETAGNFKEFTCSYYFGDLFDYLKMLGNAYKEKFETLCIIDESMYILMLLSVFVIDVLFVINIVKTFTKKVKFRAKLPLIIAPFAFIHIYLVGADSIYEINGYTKIADNYKVFSSGTILQLISIILILSTIIIYELIKSIKNREEKPLIFYILKTIALIIAIIAPTFMIGILFNTTSVYRSQDYSIMTPINVGISAWLSTGNKPSYYNTAVFGNILYGFSLVFLVTFIFLTIFKGAKSAFIALPIASILTGILGVVLCVSSLEKSTVEIIINIKAYFIIYVILLAIITFIMIAIMIINITIKNQKNLIQKEEEIILEQ